MKEQTHVERMMDELKKLGIHEGILHFYNRHIEELGTSLKVLDLGAGNGLVSTDLCGKPYVESVVAYDRNLEAMRQLKEIPKLLKTDEGEITNLPFKNGQFDVVICRFAFHHFENKPKVLNEIHRVLSEYGRFLYTDPVLPEHSKAILNPLYYIREDNFHGYLGYFETLELFQEAGFMPLVMRPHTISYPTFEKYLGGVENGFENKLPETKSEIIDILKAKIKRAWASLDTKTAREMGLTLDDISQGFTYPMIDAVLVKNN